MATKRVMLVAVVALLYLSAAFIVKTNADELSSKDKRTELVAAAKEAYEAVEAEFKRNRVVLDDVYLWSRRLRDAEKLLGANPKAAAKHTKRMRDLNDWVLFELPKQGPQKVGIQHLQTKYYVLQAEYEEEEK